MMLSIFSGVFQPAVRSSQMIQWEKNSPEMQEMQADASSIPRSGRSSGEGMAIHSCILAWRMP